MIFPGKEIIEQVHKEYPVGTRVELLKMDDPQAPSIGTKGTVQGVDDTASLLVDWDNGSSLNVIYGKDRVRKVIKMTKDEGIQKIHEIVKELFGDGVSVNIFVNSEGIDCNVNYKPYPSLGCSMRNVNGKWLKKQRRTNQ